MSYLNFTKDFGITYVRGSGLDLSVFVDASYADNEVDRRSTTGLAGVKEALCVRGVLSFIAPETSGAEIKDLEDNKGALAFIENPFSSARSKHIDVRFHFIRELFKSGKITAEYVPTGEQHAEWLTKAYDTSNGADYRGSRKVTLGLLSGSVLPMWSALEKTVAVCRSQMTKAEEALKVFDRCGAVVVNRVILDDSTKLVGVRLPTTALSTLRQHLAEAVQARKAVVDSGGGGGVDPMSPINPKTLLQVKTPPNNILSFFGRATSPSPSSAAIPSPVGGKRQAGVSSGGCSAGRVKKRKGSVGGSERNAGKNSASSTVKGVAALFGSQLGSKDIASSTASAKRDDPPEVISIDD
ncbi:unnamed protein product [Ectocarpus sp. CCAP 1310/34]|nr:unnamed protein product [Ectocarpus sp. CCAP 1310/34]